MIVVAFFGSKHKILLYDTLHRVDWLAFSPTQPRLRKNSTPLAKNYFISFHFIPFNNYSLRTINKMDLTAFKFNDFADNSVSFTYAFHVMFFSVSFRIRSIHFIALVNAPFIWCSTMVFLHCFYCANRNVATTTIAYDHFIQMIWISQKLKLYASSSMQRPAHSKSL